MEKRIHYAQQANKEMYGYLQPSPKLNQYTSGDNSLYQPHMLINNSGSGNSISTTSSQFSVTGTSLAQQMSSNSLQSSSR